MNWVSLPLSIGMLALGFSVLKIGLTVAPLSLVMIAVVPFLTADRTDWIACEMAANCRALSPQAAS
jgi:hypothetical protein